MDQFKLKKITISGIGGITELAILFNKGLNLICGTNGIGKTTILECIAHAFIKNSTQKLKKNVNYPEGKCTIDYSDGNNDTKQVSYTLSHFKPIGQTDFLNRLSGKSNCVLYFTPQRNIVYKELQSLAKDPERGADITAGVAYSGVSADDEKNWFVQRFMWSAHQNVLQPEQINNFNKAKDCFNLLDKEVRFSKVIPDTYDIMVNTPQGEVYFEYLSAGYKSCIYILLGIIKEIEYRFKNPYINVQDFAGIILIDEIDVHLHPQWQKSLVVSLKALIPNAQIVATTHSPSMIQCAEPNEIIALQYNENREMIVTNFGSEKYGFQGWTLEEILTDVMGMSTIRSDVYSEKMKEFESAINEDDGHKAEAAYNELVLMLNPKNHLRKILELQIAGLKGHD